MECLESHREAYDAMLDGESLDWLQEAVEDELSTMSEDEDWSCSDLARAWGIALDRYPDLAEPPKIPKILKMTRGARREREEGVA